MKHALMLAGIGGALLSLLPAIPADASVMKIVPGSANPYLAGQPDGTPCCGGDSTPGEMAVFAGNVVGGGVLTFSGIGGVSYYGGSPAAGADGDNDRVTYTYRFSMSPDYATGIAGAQNVNVDGLVGVFIDGSVPGGPAPAPLDFSATSEGNGLDFQSLTPGLNQIFWIGDGLTGIETGQVQQFVAPTNATRLYLGTVDGSGWSNNTGAISVTITGLSAAAIPEPTTWAMMVTGFGLVGAALPGRRKANPALRKC